MPLTWLHDLTMRLAQEVVTICKHLIEGTWHPEGPSIGGDACHRAQCKRRQSELCISGDNIIEPAFAYRMLRQISPKRIYKHIDIGQYHRSLFACARSSA